MDNKRESVAHPGVALGSEVHGLKTNGHAPLDELREFLAALKGRNPQEVIGIVSSSLLIQSMVLATIGTVVFMAVFTVVPYWLYGPLKAGPTAAHAPPAANAAAAPPATPAAGKTADASATKTSDSDSDSPAQADAAKAAKTLGLDETKAADPSKNPLESSPNLDKLLDQ